MTKVLLLLLAMQALPHQLWGTEYVVAPGGDDHDPGTARQPFASIQRAQTAARARIAKGLTADLVIELRSGRYVISEPLVFDARDSGTAQHSVVYAASAGQTPIISGGQRIDGWQQTADGVFEAPVAQLRFRELFVQGERRPRARHPNKGFFRVETVGADRRTGFTAQPGDLEAMGDLAGAELLFLHDWCGSRIPIKAFDPTTRYLTSAFPVGNALSIFAMDNFEKQPRYAVEHHPAALDAPGEWYLDNEKSLVRYRPLPGELPTTLDAIVPVACGLVEVHGATNGRIRNLHLRGLTFEHCAWLPPSGGYAPSQATWHERRNDGTGGPLPIKSAVTLDGIESCSISACRFAHLGGSGVWLRRECRENRIEGNHFVDISGNGLMIGEPGQREMDQNSSGNQVTNNLIEHCGGQYFGAVAVWVGITNNTRVEHNLIRHHPYTGVSLGWSWNARSTEAANNIVAHNHIHGVMQLLSDGGGIYTLGNQPGSYLRANHIHDVPLNLGRSGSNGIFMDEGSTGFTVENNLIYDISRAPIRFHRATKNLVRNNILGTGPDIQMFRYVATNEELITKQGNRPIRNSSPPSPADLETVDGAGLQPAFREALFAAGEDGVRKGQ